MVVSNYWLIKFKMNVCFSVPRKVLKEDMEEATQADELLAEADEADDLDGYDTDDFFRESAAFSPSPNVHGGSREPPQASATTTPKPAPPHARTKGAEAKGLQHASILQLQLI